MKEKVNCCRINILSYYFTMEVIKMKNIKNLLVSRSMKIAGFVALFLGTIVITPASTLGSHQPKCPDEFLK